jgi:hypothetical protein
VKSPYEETRSFLSDDRLKGLIHNEEIRNELKRGKVDDDTASNPAFLSFIINDAPRCFATLVYMSKSRAIVDFWKFQFRDIYLPIGMSVSSRTQDSATNVGISCSESLKFNQ